MLSRRWACLPWRQPATSRIQSLQRLLSAAPSPAPYAGPFVPAAKTVPSGADSDDRTQRAAALNRIRNIGIIAHIDAGKTTTTERMLYLVGKTGHQGSVDSGDTVTDFMPQERERGITIQSAAVSFPWADAHINLIDTPGHVDFSIEVERCARVLDGAVLVLDAVAGVQAQTETVWRTAQRFGVPAIAFVNKMDREGADFARATASLQTRLGMTPLPIQLPLGTSAEFEGSVDLLTMQALVYGTGGDRTAVIRPSARDAVALERMSLEQVEKLHPGISQKAHKARQKMLEGLANVDEEFAESWLLAAEEGRDHPLPELLGALRRACLTRSGVPVLCGASIKGMGVEPLLDSVVSLLPSPLETPPASGHLMPGRGGAPPDSAGPKNKWRRPQKSAPQVDGQTPSRVSVDPLGKDLVALAFKVTHDARRGPVVFFRVYSGQLRARDMVWNVTQGIKERPTQLLQVEADDMKAIEVVPAGQVAAAVGLAKTDTGDTLLGVQAKQELHLSGVTAPEPVFTLALEAQSASHHQKMEEALAVICREDPSLRTDTDQDSGQLLLRGLGELHLEIVCDRLKREFNVDVRTGRAFVAYRECVTQSVSRSEDYDRVLGGKELFAGLDVQVEPLDDAAAPVEVDMTREAETKLNAEQAETVIDAVHGACQRGPLGGFPLRGTRVTVTGARCTRHTTKGALSHCAALLVNNALREAGAMVMEPLMRVEVSVTAEHVGTVLNDLNTNRRAKIHDMEPSDMSSPAARQTVAATVPLRELLGYATALRSVTQGEGSFSMEFVGYGIMDSHSMQLALTPNW